MVRRVGKLGHTSDPLRSVQRHPLVALAFAAGMLTALVGGGYLAAWLGGLMAQRGATAITIKTNAALALLFSGTALALLVYRGSWQRGAGRACAAAALLIGALTLFENITGQNLGIDQLLAHEPPGALGVRYPNRMGLPASLGFTLASAALLLLSRRDRRWLRTAQGLALAVLVIALLPTIGYVYSVRGFYEVAGLTAAAWPIALALLTLSLGILFARPRGGLMAQVFAQDAGGTIIRRLLIPALLLPVILGWLRLAGSRWGMFDAPMGTGLLTLSYIIVFTTLLYHTGRKLSQSAAAQRESEQRFHIMADVAPVLIWQCRPDRNCDYFNKGWLEFTGRTLEQELGCGWAEGVHDADMQRCLEVFTSAVERREPFEMEYRLRHRSGEFRWVLDRGVPRFGPDGTFLGYIGGCIDIHDRKCIEEELASVAQFPAENPHPVLRLGPEGQLLYANHAAEALLMDQGWQPGQAAVARLWDAADATLRSGKISEFDLPCCDQRVFSFACMPMPAKGYANLYGRDVTEARRAEAALRQSEQRFSAFMHHLSGAVWMKDLQGRYVYINPEAERIFSMTQSQIQGKTDEEIFPPETARQFRDNDRRALSEGGVVRTTEILRQSDGAEHLWISNKFLVPGPDGQPAFIGGIAFDITERKQAEESLAESRQRLSGIVQSAMDAIITLDEQQRIVLFNPAAEQMFRCPADQALGSSIDRFIPHRFREIHRHHIHEFARTGSTARAMGHLRPLSALRADGQEFPIEASISQVQVDNHKLFTVILRDITQRQQAETTLRQSERRFRGTFENAAVGIAHVDIQGRLILVNQKLSEILGLTREELMGQRFVDLTYPEDREPDASQFAALMRGERDSYAVEKRYLRRDGQWTWVLVTRGVQRDESGCPIYSISIVQDITWRKEAERALQAAMDSAERAKAAAEQANAAKDQFLAVLSHELRTPLTPVLMTAQMLETDQNLPEPAREQIEMIRRNVELEARLIDDLLDVTRIARGKIELDRKPVALCKVIRRAVEVVQADLEARGLHFGVDLGNAAPYLVHADPARLQQVFWNLLKNAVKFTPRGGCVGIRCRAEDHSVVAEVNDSGRGIDPAVLPRIFKPFEQGGANITRQFGGLGLGLTITRGLVEMHGGSITALSDGMGKGTTFRVKLPLYMPSQPQAARSKPEHGLAAGEPQHSAPPEPRSLRILLVEDHGDTARIMRRLLTADGHEVATADDVATALELATSQPFDLLISDLGLPDGSGIDLIRELHARRQTLPAIALSGYGQEEDIRRSHDAGFVTHLTKPTSPDRLAEAIAAITRPPTTPPSP